MNMLNELKKRAETQDLGYSGLKIGPGIRRFLEIDVFFQGIAGQKIDKSDKSDSRP